MKPPLCRVIAWIFLVVMLLPDVARVAAAAEPARSVAVVPLEDGDADARSAEVAAQIGEALRITTAHRIVDARAAAKILTYQEPSAASLPEAEAAASALTRAKEHYFAFRTREAKAELDRTIAAMEAKPERSSALGALLLDAYVTRAVMARAGGDEQVAREALRRALVLDPQLDLAAEQYPPRLVAIAEEERRTLATAPAGRVAVSTKPPVAELFVNGIRRGTTPIEIELPAGTYRLLLRANRYADVERSIEVVAGARQRVRETLRWAEAASASGAKANDAAAAVAEGLRIGGLVSADAVILIDADAGDAGERIEARMVDRSLRAGRTPIVLAGTDAANPIELARCTDALAAQLDAGVAADPARDLEPRGLADAALLEKRRRPLHTSPVFWGILGALLAGALGGGLAAAFSGGSGDMGQVRVEFR